MKIRIRYDEKITNLEISEEDVTVLIDTDYEDRLAAAEDKEIIERRSPQEIMDELYNKPDYNNWHKFDRHRGMPKKPYRKDEQAEDKTDHMDYIPDYSDEERREEKLEYESVCELIHKTLKPDQAEIIIAIYLDGISVTEYAENEGVSVSAISHRLNTAKRNFKKVYPNTSTFHSSQG